MTSPWYETFFSELPNEFWRRAAPAESARDDVRFAAERLALASDSAVLDVPCGSGRHCIALAADGHVLASASAPIKPPRAGTRSAGSGGHVGRSVWAG